MAISNVFHDHIWQNKRCRKHGKICALYVREDGTEIHIKTREPKKVTNTDGPPCIGCRGRKAK